MALAEKFLDAQPTKFGLPCGVAELLKELPDNEREAFLKIMEIPASNRKRLSNRKIHSILLSEGYDTSFSSISLHRRRACRCFTGKSSRDSV